MNIYIVKVSSKYFNKLIRYSIYFQKIEKVGDYYYLSLDKENYKKIERYRKLYLIEDVDYKGFIKYKKIVCNHIIFFILFIISIIYIVFLSNLIFDVQVKTNNKELEKFVLNELKNMKISPFNFVVPFSKKEKIKQDILKKNKDRIEWMEITRKGVKYIVNVEERKSINNDYDNSPRDIIASKNAILLKIEAKKGSIVKKLNDYVKRGDVVVTGSITHKEEIVDLVKADAIIYGETWYKVHVSYPISYYEKTFTGNTKKRLSLNFFNKSFEFGSGFKKEEVEEFKILENKFFPIKLGFDTVKEMVLIDDVYTVEEAVEIGTNKAEKELLEKLPDDSKILNQKKLKIIVNNSTIDMDIFFKVYENITDIRKIEKGDIDVSR